MVALLRIIDLTHRINKDISLFPGAKGPVVTVVATIESDFYLEHEIMMGTHLGTHIDSPMHVLKQGKLLNEYDVSKFIGKALVIDVEGLTFITVDFLKQVPHIEEVEFILFKTGMDKYYGTADYYKPFPVLDEKGAFFVANLDNLKGIGVDSFSIDPIEPVSIDNHKIILGSDLIIIENLTHLYDLLNVDFTFSCLPLKFDEIEGCPVRAIAMIHE